MVRVATTLFILVSLAAHSTAVYASDCACTKKHTFQFFERPDGGTLVFSASKRTPGSDVPEKGDGFIYTINGTKAYEPDSELYASESGLYFFVSNTALHAVSTISFLDINEEGGPFVGADIFLRGLWRLNADGTDVHRQEFGVVGGSKGLAGAYGSVVFTKLDDKVWLAEGVLFTDIFPCDSQKNALNGQITHA